MVGWGARWRVLLDVDGSALALRVSRGRAYERAGRVTDMRVIAGALSARVQGSRATPYGPEIGVSVFDDREWDLVVNAVAGQARYAARLLANQVPEGLERDLEAQGLALFPQLAELDMRCSCDDPLRPCKHIAATMESAATQFDADPFLLLRLRGRGRERVLADLAAGRRGGQGDAAGQPPPGGDRTAWSRAGGALDDGWLDEELPPAVPLAERGAPPGWEGGISPDDLFGPLIDRGELWARELLKDAASKPVAATS